MVFSNCVMVSFNPLVKLDFFLSVETPPRVSNPGAPDRFRVFCVFQPTIHLQFLFFSMYLQKKNKNKTNTANKDSLP